jgi:hypothetical protein
LPEHPNAFTRTRCLPLPKLIAALLSMRSSSQQVMLDLYGRLPFAKINLLCFDKQE